MDVGEGITVAVKKGVLAAVGMTKEVFVVVGVRKNVFDAVGVKKGVFVAVGVNNEMEDGVTVKKDVLDDVGFCKTVVGILTGISRVGVNVIRARFSGVMVGTGTARTPCKVAARSFGLPVEGISIIIWLRIFSLTTAITVPFPPGL